MERFDKNSVFLLFTVISSLFNTSVIEAALGVNPPHRHSLKICFTLWKNNLNQSGVWTNMFWCLWKMKLVRCCIERDDWISWRIRQTVSQSVGFIISAVCLPAVFWFLFVNMNTDHRHLLVWGGISSNTERTSELDVGCLSLWCVQVQLFVRH